MKDSTLGWAWHIMNKKVYFFRGCSWGIAEVIESILRTRKSSEGIVFLPDYFCNQALMPLRRKPFQIIFYRIKEDLTPGWSLMESLISKYGPPDVFILVHYFGFPSKVSEALKFCRTVGAVFIEDCAHVLMPFGEVGKYSLANAFSPYKLLPVPSVGLLVAPEDLKINEGISGQWVDSDTLKWIGKRLLQSFLMKCRIPWRRKVLPFDSDPKIEVKKDHRVSPLPLKLLRSVESEIENVRKIRRNNYNRLVKKIDNLAGDIVSPVYKVLPEGVCPYVLPLHVRKDIIALIYQTLNRFGIPAQTWPDLPPEIKENPLRHPVAIKLRKEIITMPVHQSLTEKQICYIAASLQKSVLEAVRN